MLEIEMKFRCPDLQALRRRIEERGARPAGSRVDFDTYFNAPHRNFAETDEAFRIRQIGDRSFLTYKGPRIDQQTKTRREIEVELATKPGTGAMSAEMLLALGFHQVAVVKKEREMFHHSIDGFDVEITLDRVENVGHYAELEIMAEEPKLPAAKAALLQLASDLGLTQSERRSYLELLLARH